MMTPETSDRPSNTASFVASDVDATMNQQACLLWTEGGPGLAGDGRRRSHRSSDWGSVDDLEAGEEPSVGPSSSVSLMETNDGRPEPKAVLRLKLLLVAFFLCSTVAVALLVYFFARDAESSALSNRFNDEAGKLLDAVGNGFYHSMGALDAYVVDLVTQAESSNSQWPFVSLLHYAVRASKLRTHSRAFYLGQYHLVTNETREEWERYSLQNGDSWVKEVLQVQKSDSNYHGVLLDTYQPYGVIHNNEGDSEGPGPFLPAWHSYPLIPHTWPPFNWDGNSYIPMASSFEEVFGKRHVVARISNLPDLNDVAAMEEVNFTNRWAKDYIRPEDDETEPILDIYYPISTDSVNSVSQEDPPSENGSVVGLINANMYFWELLRDVIPEGSGGVMAVFQVGDVSFTYKINGPRTTFLGRGDHHNPKFDYLKRGSFFLDVKNSSNHIYTGLPLGRLTRNATVFVYPTDEMESVYISNNPTIYTVIAVLTFAFTSAIFITYDRLRSAALARVVHHAVESHNTNTILEERVKQRTHELQKTNRRLEEAHRRVVRSSEAQLQHFACMSHEIRTPLNCVIGMTSLLIEEATLSAMQAETVQMIATSGELLLTIVNDVLDYSKLESGNIEITKTHSNLSDVLSSTIHSMSLKGADKNVNVSTLYDVSVPEFMYTDVRRLSQILYNLLGNAVKFSNPGSTVELSVMVLSLNQAPSAVMENRYSPRRMYENKPLPPLEGTVIRFVVKDYGRGINPAAFSEIFRPFRQADLATESLYGGTGLGLSITSKLVHGLGGSITVESIEGQWSTFTVDLPLPPEAALVPTDTRSSELQNVKVLFVGCDECDRKRMSDILSVIKVYHAFHSDLAHLRSKVSFNDEEHAASDETLFIFVVNERVHDPFAFAVFMGQRRSALFTFGPAFKFDDGLRHYRSLTQTLPSIFLGDIVRYMQVPAHAVESVRENVLTDFDIMEPYHGKRFLIAEDNLVNQKVLSRILTRLGISNYEIVDNGQKAVEREACEAFDVIFMDVQMPVMSGIEATRIINTREKESHPRARIIFCTAQVGDHLEDQCHTAGATAFLAKPCTIQEVKQCLITVFGDS